MSAPLGWALPAVPEKATARADVIWTGVAAVVLLLSFLPFGGVETSGGSKAVLALTHVAVGEVLIPSCGRRRDGRRIGEATDPASTSGNRPAERTAPRKGEILPPSGV